MGPLLATLRSPWPRRELKPQVHCLAQAARNFSAVAKSLPQHTKKLTDLVAVNFGILPASSADSFCSSFRRSTLSPIAAQMINLDDARAESCAASVKSWLHAMTFAADGDDRASDAAVDHFVGQVLQASWADVNGDDLLLLPQRYLRTRIGEKRITSRPDFTVRGRDSDVMSPVLAVSHNSAADALSWADIGGEMLIAALHNADKLAAIDRKVQMVGIRVVNSRFTFFKAAFDIAALSRLQARCLAPDYGFPISCWGGATCANRETETKEENWGLDFGRSAEEREQVMLMLSALGEEMRAWHRDFNAC